MTERSYVGVNGVARTNRKDYAGVNGVARKVLKVYAGVDGVARLSAELRTFTASFDANGGMGTTAPVSTPEAFYPKGTVTVPANSFTRQYHDFTGWNTASNGSGTAYAPGSKLNLTGDTTLYAQWKVQTATVRWWKKHNNEYVNLYPPATNTGPVHSDSTNYYYLDMYINGTRVEGLNDKFTEEGAISPPRSQVVDKGSTVRIIVRNKKSGITGGTDNCRIYWNGTSIEGPSSYIDYSFTVTGNVRVELWWDVIGVAAVNGQSYWSAHIWEE